MKLTGYFQRFLKDTVNLDPTRLNLLNSRVDSITAALQASMRLDDRMLDIVPQGSWAHQTIIKPGTNIEFDADFLVRLKEDPDWTSTPRSYANAVWGALNNDSTYGSMSKQKNRCVAVTYANDCHVDVVTCIVRSDDSEVIVNREENAFEDTNPVGFTDWIREKDDLTNGNLRKCLRLLKYLRDHRAAFKLKSVLLTTMVGNVADQWRSFDADYYKDVPTTLVHLVEDLDTWLQSTWSRPSITDPSCSSTSFDHRWTDAQYTAFKSKIHEIAPKMRAAYDAGTTAESVVAWQAVFGPSFPSSLAARSATTAAASLTKAFVASDRAPDEQFIEEQFAVNVTHTVRVECDISELRRPNSTERRGLRNRAGRVPKQRDLYFEVVHTDVPAPFDVYWKIRNRGGEAATLGALRGEINKDAGRLKRKETTQYTGHHFVECYIVKDGICVARTHEPVIIA